MVSIGRAPSVAAPPPPVAAEYSGAKVVYATPRSINATPPASPESDSSGSEELHYGPGFVSRLRSRYLSVALRNNRSSAPIRRTASLEDFLQELESPSQEKVIENDPKVKVGLYMKKGHHQQNNRGRSTNRRDSIKRAQSVEVLTKVEMDRRHEIISPAAPPPLPPKKLPFDNVVNTLANDNIVIVDKSANSSSSSSPPVVSAPAPPVATAISVSQVGGTRRAIYKRRSSSSLFGVEEKELPAPDTVRETRKIFEMRSEGKAPGPFNYRGILTKSKSSSNLYHNRSPSVDRFTRKASDDSNVHRSHFRRCSVSSSTSSSSSSSVPIKPVLPTKPVHLSHEPYKPHPTYPLESVVKKDSRESKEVYSGDEEGIKRVSREAIHRIREGGNSFSFNFQNPTGHRNHLATDKENNFGRQVGVIRPITRELKREKEEVNVVKEKNEINEGKKKEVLVIEKDTLSWMSIAEANRQQNRARFVGQMRDHSQENKIPLWLKQQQMRNQIKTKPEVVNKVNEDEHDFAKENNQVNGFVPNKDLVRAKPVLLAEKDPPVKDLIIVDKSEPLAPKRVTSFADQSKPKDHKIPKVDSFEKALHDRAIAKGKTDTKEELANDDGSSDNYRESWKKRAEDQNSMVFNFSNSSVDVTHIENDGRDISKRISAKKIKKKTNAENRIKDSGVVLLSVSGCSVDTTDSSSEDSDVDVHRPVSPCNFVVIGAHENTETRSALRKNNTQKKKLTLSFSASLTEIFEYPSYDSAVSESVANRFKDDGIKANSAIGSTGGLGSYTPSKIQMTESPFELGVSRTPTPTSGNSTPTPTNTGGSSSSPSSDVTGSSDSSVRPAEDGAAWSGTSTADILF